MPAAIESAELLTLPEGTKPYCEVCGDRRAVARVRAYRGIRLCIDCRKGTKALEKEDGWMLDARTRRWKAPAK